MFESVSLSSPAARADVLVVGYFQGEGLDKATRALDVDRSLSAALKRAESTGESGRLSEAFPKGRSAGKRALLLGLGKRGDFKPGSLRHLAGGLAKKLADLKATSAALELAGPLGAADAPAGGQALGEGLALASWTGDTFRGSGTSPSERAKLMVWSKDAGLAGGLKKGLALGASANLTRRLSQTPPNIATPMWIAREAQTMAKGAGLTCSVLHGPALVKEKMEGLINVGKASENEPCLIRLEYVPKGGGGRGGKGERPVVLVGKTITYDTGGLSLKINNGMRGMKRDKDGGCAVLGAMHAIATVIKPGTRVVALLAAAENSISDEAYRPDDILTYRNGVTVEVTNTDAEGRLVLADALCWACEKENPACIIDLATLTGGVVVALGSTYAGMFCEDDALRARIEAASRASGERVWRLPMHQEYRDLMKSTVADIVNSNPNRKAHPIQGAAFLASFVKDGVPWCHLDIAGVHAVEGASGPFAAETPTGWGVRLLASFLEQG